MPYKGAGLEEWGKLILTATKRTEGVFRVKAYISRPIFDDVIARVNKGLEALKVEDPNSAKVAGIAAFWIRKLKPIFHGGDAARVFLAINEYVSLIVGLGICYRSDPATDVSIAKYCRREAVKLKGNPNVPPQPRPHPPLGPLFPGLGAP
jgi:hypothetical protein